MVNGEGSLEPDANARTLDDDVERPSFISEDVWRVVELAARQNKVPVSEYVEKALLDEAMILEQVRFGRRWLVKNERGDVAEVDFA